VGADFLHAEEETDKQTDGQTYVQTDRHDEAFRNLANAPKMNGNWQHPIEKKNSLSDFFIITNLIHKFLVHSHKLH
jgi:hypothetical protein